jgi:2-polyprenyl-3-methyl-5-hydroxy-6-metoxy-1,4-benzoquinol methylase
MLKAHIKNLVKRTPFAIVSIGDYIRSLYFFGHLKRLPVIRFANVLDAGCGDGHYARRAALQYPHMHVVGIDIKLPEAERDMPSNVSLRCGDLSCLAEEDHYDLIYSIDVLEHIPNNPRVIENFYLALKYGGYLYIHMPNKLRGPHMFPEGFFDDFQAWSAEEHIGEHYALPELTSLLRQKGFEIMESAHTFGTIGLLAWEIDRVTDRHHAIKSLLMPFLKTLSILAVRLKAGRGDILVIGRKIGARGHEQE